MNLTRNKFKEIFLVFKNKALSGSTGKVDSRSKKGICCNILKMTSPSSLRTHWKNNIHLHMFLGTLSVILQSFNQSVQFSHSVMPNSLQPHGLQHAKPPYPSPTPRVYSNSCPLSWWCHPTILSSVVPFSSCLQSFPASGSFQMSQFFHISWPKYWSFSFSNSPSNEYSGLTFFRMDFCIFLQSKGLSRVFPNTIVQNHQFFGVQLSSTSNSHIHTWLLEKP